QNIFFAKYNNIGNYLNAGIIGSYTNKIAIEKTKDITLDSSGNVYVIGDFNGTADFDPSNNTANLTSITDNENIFFAKYDSNGNYIWAKAILAIDFHCVSKSLALDDDGNLYITGYVDGNVDFDPSNGIANLGLGGIGQNFIAKYDNNGNYLWAKLIGGRGSNDANPLLLALDNANNIYVSGSFVDTKDFDPGAGTANLTAVGGDDIFIAKYNTNGDYLWAKALSGTDDEVVNSMALDNSGNFYLTGRFSGTSDFDPGVGTANFNCMGWVDLFIAKYDGNGNYLWTKTIGGPDYEMGCSLALDSNDNIYLTGDFSPSVDFDPGVGVAIISEDPNGGTFIAKYDTNGNYIWAEAINYSFPILDLELDNNNNIYISGNFTDDTDFDPGIGITSFNTEDTNWNLFLAKYDTNGSYLWAGPLASGKFDHKVIQSLASDDTGNIYLGGNFLSTANFNVSTGTYNLTTLNNHDMFVAKYNMSSLSVNENTLSNTIKLYPNPTKNNFTLAFEEYKNGTVCILDILGNKIQEYNFTNQDQIKISLDNVASGIYLVQLLNGIEKTTYKVIKQ
uniref:T9SS type A sorting domain-containing protein n=1 Tax=Flavobacterium sp. TaxID=239 RepID=UPI00261D0EF7